MPKQATRTISGHPLIRSVRSLWLRKATVPGRPKIWIRVCRVYAPLFLRLLVLLDQVEPLTMRNTWSFFFRPPRMGGSTDVSDHDGYAIDAWSDRIGAHTWPSRMPAPIAIKISHILEQFKTEDGRHIFGWGACNKAPGVVYTGPTYSKPASHDPMHFYIAPGITPADAKAAIKRLRIKSNGTIAKAA